MRNRVTSFHAFTLLELLVVMAIIGILITLLLCGLDLARESGLRTVAIADAHQIALAGSTYQHDFKEMLPFTPVYQRGTTAAADSGPLEGLCPWSFAGVNNAPYWYGRPFDVEAADRPMNPYVASGVTFDAPPAPQSIGPAEMDRMCAQLEGLRIRGFEDSLEREWPGVPEPGENPAVSSYEDVGTSFLLNLRWLDAFSSIPDPVQRLHTGLPKLSRGAVTDAAHMVWFTDQSGEAIPRSVDPTFSWTNAFDDDNRSVMGFIDGHVVYAKVHPGVVRDPDYTLTLTRP